jgi:hypothetical protein
MKMKLLAAAIATAAAFGAHATTTDWGIHGPLEVVATQVGAGSFSDLVWFSIPTPSDLSSTTVANNLTLGSTQVLNINGGQVSLYKEAGATDTLLASYSFDGTTGSTSHTVADLGAGQYYYQITGTASGNYGGFYSLTSTVSPVPEPETYALLLAGLGVVGSLYRRRKQG